MLSICRSKSTHSTLCTVFSPHSSKTDKGKQGVILIFFFFFWGGRGGATCFGVVFFSASSYWVSSGLLQASMVENRVGDIKDRALKSGA